jgi:hypothetical protein
MQAQIELDADTRAALARCYLRFARRGRQLMAQRAAQQAAQPAGELVQEDAVIPTNAATDGAAEAILSR